MWLHEVPQITLQTFLSGAGAMYLNVVQRLIVSFFWLKEAARLLLQILAMKDTVQVPLASLPELVQMICMNQLILRRMQPLSPASEFLL